VQGGEEIEEIEAALIKEVEVEKASSQKLFSAWKSRK
jgi:hypothetical protein